MENKQSSVEWLEQQLNAIREQGNIEIENLIWQAKEMHKDEIEQAQIIAISKADMTNNRGYFDTEKYYNETFGGEK